MASGPDPKLVKLVNRFRGISQYKNQALSTLDEANDLLNVMPSTIGNLEKLRVPILRGPQATNLAHIDTMFFFSQGNGTRQMFINGGNFIGYYIDPETGAQWNYFPIDNGGKYGGRLYYVLSNNLLFMCNGTGPFKWNGAAITAFGISQPAAPTLGITLPILTISRSAGGIITLTFDPSALPAVPDVNKVAQGLFNSAPLVGDMVSLSGIAGDPTLNGIFPVATNNGSFVVTLTATGGAVGPFNNQGTIKIFGCTVGPIPVTTVSRSNGVAVYTLANNFLVQVGEQFTVAAMGAGVTSFNGTFVATAANAFTITCAQGGIDVPTTASGGGTVVGGFTSAVTPRTWRFGWADIVLGHEGPSSGASAPLSLNSGLVTNYRAFLTVAIPGILAGFPQGANNFYLYANQDGGSIWVLQNTLQNTTQYSLTPDNGASVCVTDGSADNVFDPTQQANFINFPPPIDMRFMSKWQGRIFGAGMASAPQDIVFSGYDQILRGRPEQSFPPLNRIRLAIGADAVRGFGILMNGVVAWDQSNKMYLFEGTIEDIIATQPVLLTAYLADEPWQTGLSSHLSVQSTPRGVIWVAADLTVQIWNGIFYGELIGPRDLTVNAYPLMKRITPSTKANIQSAFFNWIERDWYAILVCLDGSVTYNYLIFFDLAPEAADNLGIWICNIQADSICVKEDSTGVRHLIITQGGAPYELVVNSTSVSGIHQNPTSTSAELSAFWLSGWWQEQPHIKKMYRYGRLTCDQDGFQLITTVLNDETNRLRDTQQSHDSWSKNLSLSPGGRFATNRKGRRQQFQIVFPIQDVDASVLELYTTAIALAEI